MLPSTTGKLPQARLPGLVRFFSLSPGERDRDALSLDAIRRQLEQLEHRSVPTEDAVGVYGWLLGVRSAVDLEPEECGGKRSTQ